MSLSGQPKIGRLVQLHQVLDKRTRERIGFVETMKYDNGQSLMWIKDKERVLKLGYITPSNQGYRYTWHAGKRSDKPEFIGADTVTFNARKILSYDSPAELAPITLQQLADELRSEIKDAEAASKPAAADSEDEE